MTPDIIKLEAEITAAQEAISEQTRLAVSEARTQAALLKRGKELAERKEVLKLLQLQLRQAKRDHVAQKAAEDQAERLGRRRQIAEIAGSISEDVKKLASAIRKAGPHYKSINDKAWQIMQLGQEAADFDLSVFKSSHPTSKAYEILIHLVAKEFGLGPANPFSSWPRSHQIEESIQKALATFADIADWPREVEPEVDEFEEVKEEELAHVIY